MKKIYHYENLSGAGLVTGRAVRLIRDSDGLEVDCTEIGATGKYLAEMTGYGIYSVFDVTNGSPGVDLDQKMDFFSSQTIAQQITFPGDHSLFLDGDAEFRGIEISDIDGLGSAIEDKEPKINPAGNARYAWFGNKAFRAIEENDLPSGLLHSEILTQNMTSEYYGLPGAAKTGNVEIKIIEIEKGKAYSVTAKTGGTEYIHSDGGAYQRIVKAYPSSVDGDMMSRFLSAVVATAGNPSGVAIVRNFNASTFAVKRSPSEVKFSYLGTALYIEFGLWENNDMYNGAFFMGTVING